MPQPEWFSHYSVESQEQDPESTLNLYRSALRLRRELQSGEALEWLSTHHDTVLAFRRPNGWICVTNFGEVPASLPSGELLLSSSPLTTDGELPAEATAWLQS